MQVTLVLHVNLSSTEVRSTKTECMKLNGLGANHLTLGGEGGVSLKKISCKRLSEEKNCMEHKCNRKLIGKKGKKYPAHQIATKKHS